LRQELPGYLGPWKELWKVQITFAFLTLGVLLMLFDFCLVIVDNDFRTCTVLPVI
jgi:hypothetical protein